MKVKIAYTVDFDDVPELMEQVLSSMKQDLSDCTQKLKFRPNDLVKMMEDFEHARTRLDIVDSQIQDILQIATGWSQAARPAVEPEKPEVVEETHNEDTD